MPGPHPHTRSGCRPADGSVHLLLTTLGGSGHVIPCAAHRSFSIASRGAEPYSDRMPGSRLRPTLCLQCGEPIRQPTTGRRREICANRQCERAAAAERQRIRRRKRAGIPISPFMDAAPPAPRGGRDPLALRLAKQLALCEWPGVSLTPTELQTLVAAIRAGATTRFAIESLAHGQHPPGDWIQPISNAARESLADLLRRAPSPALPERRAPEVRDLEEVALDAGLALDPITGAWVRRR